MVAVRQSDARDGVEGLVEVGDEVVDGARCRPRGGSSAGSTASGESAADAWVMRAGCSMSDSTPPSDSASVNRRVRATSSSAVVLAADGEERHHPAEVAHLPRPRSRGRDGTGSPG